MYLYTTHIARLSSDPIGYASTDVVESRDTSATFNPLPTNATILRISCGRQTDRNHPVHRVR